MNRRGFIGHSACPSCGSRDNLAVYTDGSMFCFGMGCGYRINPDGTEYTPTDTKYARPIVPLATTKPADLSHRGLKSETLGRWTYRSRTMGGKEYQIASFFEDGEVVTQKIRTPDKKFSIRGRTKPISLYGQWLWPKYGAEVLVITEGEIDAMSLDQVLDGELPVVSLPNGVNTRLNGTLDWINLFEKIILVYDNDEAGQLGMLVHKQQIGWKYTNTVLLPLNDPNEMLQAGRGGELRDLVTKAVRRPGKSIIGGTWASYS